MAKKATKVEIARIKALFLEHFKNARTELHFNNDFELLIAVMLSAQCTDKRVNMVTPALFARYPTAHAMAQADVEEVYDYVKSVSYPNAKAGYLVAMARMIEEEFGGEVPSQMSDMLRLPGVEVLRQNNRGGVRR